MYVCLYLEIDVCMYVCMYGAVSNPVQHSVLHNHHHRSHVCMYVCMCVCNGRYIFMNVCMYVGHIKFYVRLEL